MRTMGFTMKKFAVLIVLTIITLTSGLILLNTWKVQPVSFSYPAKNVFTFPLFVAQERSFFKNEGLDIELIHIPGDISVKTLISGSTHFGTTTGVVFNAILRGGDLKIVAQISKLDSVLVTNLKSVKDLKGKKIGVNANKGMFYYHFEDFLKTQGINSGDVELVIIPEANNRMQSLLAGFVDAALTTTVFVPKNVTFKTIIHLDQYSDLLSGEVAISDEMIKKNPATVRKTVIAVAKAVKYIYENRNGSIELFMKWTGKDREFAEGWYDSLILKKRYYFTKMDKENMRKQIEIYARGLGVSPVSVDQMVDFSFTDNLPKELSFGYKRY